jgi:putative hydrolase of the HAD superfamily
MKFEALVFDLDDTLIVEAGVVQTALLDTCEHARERCGLDAAALAQTLRQTCRARWYRAPAREHCVRVGVSSWEGLWARFEGEGDALACLRRWAPAYRMRSWQDALRAHGIEDPGLAGELADLFPANRRKRHAVYDDAKRLLGDLRHGYQLGLLSNGLSDLQREKAQGAGIIEYFDAILVSGDVGFGKPDRRPFDALLSRLGVVPGSALMIGDTLQTDIRGAQAAGMRTAWVNRRAEPRDQSIVPDFEISNLTELPALLQNP